MNHVFIILNFVDCTFRNYSAFFIIIKAKILVYLFYFKNVDEFEVYKL